MHNFIRVLHNFIRVLHNFIRVVQNYFIVVYMVVVFELVVRMSIIIGVLLMAWMKINSSRVFEQGSYKIIITEGPRQDTNYMTSIMVER